MIKRFFMICLMAFPLLAAAQDNTWERIEQEPAEKDNPDAKYLVENAVPTVDGKVCWEATIQAPGKKADQIYAILLAQLERMVGEPNQLGGSAVVQKDANTHQLGAIYHEWLVFKSQSLSLDRTQLTFQLRISCTDGSASVKMLGISYLYDTDRSPVAYTAEEWITDKYCVNKKHTKLYPISGKFRRKTIDRKDFIFKKFNDLLNDK